MGFWSSTASPPSPKLSSDGAPIAPDRSQRAHCWEARDGYFRCLERSSIVDSIAEKDKSEKECGREGQVFESNCASSWVIYFKKRRVMEHKKTQTMQKLEADGAQVLPGPIGPGVKT